MYMMHFLDISAFSILLLLFFRSSSIAFVCLVTNYNPFYSSTCRYTWFNTNTPLSAPSSRLHRFVDTTTTASYKLLLSARGEDNDREDENNNNNNNNSNSNKEGGGIVDAVIIMQGSYEVINSSSSDNNNLSATNKVALTTKKEVESTSPFQQMMEWCKKIFQSLAALSLEDYKIRSSILKERAAGRQLEESIARIRGETPGYIRPMYANETTIGPLGLAEKTAVQWLTEVIEEEAKRAKKIMEAGGEVVRPIDMMMGGKKKVNKEEGEEENTVEGGPLAELEQKAVNFLRIVSESELYRTTEGKYCRPMDLEEAKRGPLGEAEAKLVRAFEDITKAEQQRMELSRRRGGEVVRPIDIPGPLGEIEKAVVSIVAAERRRSREGQRRNNVVRPMDSSLPSNPLGDAERTVSESLERVRQEERKRLQGLQKYLENNRPMEKDPDSTLGFTEAFVVAIYRGPKLILKVIERVKELLNSSTLTDEENSIIQRRLTESKSLPSAATADNEDDASDNEGGSLRKRDNPRLP